jgi:hypothetical protein
MEYAVEKESLNKPRSDYPKMYPFFTAHQNSTFWSDDTM